MTLRRHRALAVVLLALYFAAAVHMAFALPAHAAPNELLNFEYVQVMRQIRGLPNRGLVDSQVRYTEWHQPPLYFAWAALYGLALPVPPAATNPPPPIAWPANPHYLSTPRGNLNPVVHVEPGNTPLLYTSRVAAALLGALGVAALYTAGRRAYGPAVGLLMASILAFQPTFLHLSGAANNDMPLTAMAAIVMSYAVLLVAKSSRQGRQERQERQGEFFSLREVLPYFVLGLLCAGTVLTKANGIFVLVFPAMALLAYLWRQRRPGRTLLAAAAVAAGLLPLWAGWLWLNTVRMRDTLGMAGSLPVGRVLGLGPLDFGHVAPFLPAVWRSYWLDWSAGDVGYGPDWLYGLWLVAVIGMLLGWLKPIRNYELGIRNQEEEPRAKSAKNAKFSSWRAWRSSRPWREHSSSSPWPLTAMVLLAFLAISYLYFAVKALTVKEAGWMVPEARWWLPGLPMLAWLLAAGYGRWWSSRRREAACLAAAAVPPLIAAALLAFHLPALYPTAERLAAAPAPAAAPLAFGDALTLLEATAGEATLGQALAVTLTWRAARDLDADYTVSTRLVAQAPDGWRNLAEHNSFPGQGLNPTRGWRAGEVWRDRLTLRPEGVLNGPTLAAVYVDVSAGGPAPLLTGSPPAGPLPGEPARPLPPLRAGRPVDLPAVAQVVVRPAAPLPLPDGAAPRAEFAASFALLAWAVDATGEAPAVTFWWRATAAPPADYTLFVQLFDAAGNLLAQADGPPNGGLSPTGIWRAGDVIVDRHRFPPGTALPAGGRLLVGAYRPDTGARAPATAAGAPLPDAALALPLAGAE